MLIYNPVTTTEAVRRSADFDGPSDIVPGPSKTKTFYPPGDKTPFEYFYRLKKNCIETCHSLCISAK